jgi:hypothetical protein
LDQEEHVAVEQHLAVCAECGAERAILQWVRQSMRLVPRPAPPEAMRRRLLSQVTGEVSLWRVPLFAGPCEEVVCKVYRGEHFVQLQEARLVRGGRLLPSLDSGSTAVPFAWVNQYRQERTDGGNLHQVFEISVRRDLA